MSKDLKNEYRYTLSDGADDEYYEEEYPDEGEYAADGSEDGDYYDDAYDDGYYDEGYAHTYDGEYDQVLPGEDKLERVLNEIADIRRSIGVPPTNAGGTQDRPGIIPSYTVAAGMQSYIGQAGSPIVISPAQPQSNGNEVAMYNEITRLREEMSRLNASHEMHVELGRLKEEMERENRHKEAQLLEEIRRLNEKISELSGK